MSQENNQEVRPVRGDIFTHESGRVVQFGQTLRASEDQSEMIMLIDVMSPGKVACVCPGAVFKEQFLPGERRDIPAAPTLAHTELAPLISPYQKGDILRHIDGGFYLYVHSVRAFGREADLDGQRVMYVHLWPFDQSAWTRPVAEFVSPRFSLASMDAFNEAMKEDRSKAQTRITDARNRRKHNTESSGARIDNEAGEGAGENAC